MPHTMLEISTFIEPQRWKVNLLAADAMEIIQVRRWQVVGGRRYIPEEKDPDFKAAKAHSPRLDLHTLMERINDTHNTFFWNMVIYYSILNPCDFQVLTISLIFTILILIGFRWHSNQVKIGHKLLYIVESLSSWKSYLHYQSHCLWSVWWLSSVYSWLYFLIIYIHDIIFYKIHSACIWHALMSETNSVHRQVFYQTP